MAVPQTARDRLANFQPPLSNNNEDIKKFIEEYQQQLADAKDEATLDALFKARQAEMQNLEIRIQALEAQLAADPNNEALLSQLRGLILQHDVTAQNASEINKAQAALAAAEQKRREEDEKQRKAVEEAENQKNQVEERKKRAEDPAIKEISSKILKDPAFAKRVGENTEQLQQTIDALSTEEKAEALKKLQAKHVLYEIEIDLLYQQILAQKADAPKSEQEAADLYNKLLEHMALQNAQASQIESLEKVVAPKPDNHAITTESEKKPSGENFVAGGTLAEREANKAIIKAEAKNYLEKHKEEYAKAHPGEKLPDWLDKARYVETSVSNLKDLEKLPKAVQEKMKAENQKPPLKVMYFSAGSTPDGKEIEIPAEFRNNFLKHIKEHPKGLLNGSPAKEPTLTVNTNAGAFRFNLNASARPLQETLKDVDTAFKAFKNNLPQEAQNLKEAKLEISDGKHIHLSTTANKPLTQVEQEQLNKFVQELAGKDLVVDSAAQRQKLTAPTCSPAVATARQATEEERAQKAAEKRQMPEPQATAYTTPKPSPP
ncbi:MAG: hypothetical protein K0S08_381 [Gammaproteobacteria bacterium]|jgi:hypothetical protein|nr:hypothetical protein [Gammaproteobacteria bacterium]